MTSEVKLEPDDPAIEPMIVETVEDGIWSVNLIYGPGDAARGMARAKADELRAAILAMDRRAEAVPVAWMNADHIRAYQDGTGEGIAWASPEPTDFYSVPLALAAAPQPPARGVVDGSVLVPKAFLEFVKNAPVSSGVCCCGDNMDGHADPMSCGHTPRDQWEYSLSQWLEEIASPPAPAVAVPEGETSLGWVDHLETHLDEDGQASPSNIRDLIRICRTVAADRDAWKSDALSMQRLLGRARKLTKQTFPGGGTTTAEIDAVLTGKPPATTKAFGWARGVHQPSTPNGPAEYDVDFVYGDDEPAGDGWFPVYREPAPAVADDPANDAAFRVLRDAGDKLSLAAQTTGGTAGRDDGLVAAIDGWTAARNKALQLRRIARYEPAPAVAPENEAEKFIQAAIDSAPEPLRRLGEWLADKLDDDDWKTADRLVIGAAVALAREPAPAVADEIEDLKERLAEAEAIISDRDERITLIDRIADLIGLPHDQELDQVTFELWFSNLPAREPAPAVAMPDGWRALVREAIDLLAERTYGSPARSPGHNARLKLEAALAAAPQPPATQNYEEKRDDGLEAGTLSEIMSAAWPEYGGNHQEPEFWRDFGEGVQFALKHLTAIRSLKGPRDE